MHVTDAVLSHLDDAYDVECGNGMLRNDYLREHNVETYLIKGHNRQKDKPSVSMISAATIAQVS